MKSQNERILNHLLKGNSITPLQALSMFNCLRLSGRIHNLRSQGYEIKTDIVIKGNKRFAKYYL